MNRRLSKGKCLLVPACILLIIAFIISGVLFASYKKAEAITSSNIDSLSTNIEEILIDGYEKNLNGRGYVFNKDIFWKLISQLSNNTVKDKNGLSTLGIKTSADFRSYNDNKDIVITIGGKKWIATYLSKNSDGEPILTLWLANDVKTSSWNESKTDLNGNYPANMYGTSSVRAITLNNGGGYAVNYNDTSLKSVAQDKENEWAIYTMSKDQGVQGSLTDFIEVPDKMSWQHTQSASASAGQSANYNNDALDVGGNGGIGSYLNKSGYKNWATDRLWLPSIAETGDSGISGIWQTSSFTRANDTSYTWVRSAHNDCYHQARLLNANGSGLNNGAGDYVVRPAFHLNLAKAEQYSATIIKSDTQLLSTYNGEEHDYFSVDGADIWYDEILFSSANANVKVEYFNADGSALSTAKPIESGEYIVKLTIQGSQYIWENGKLSHEIDFKIAQKILKVDFDPSTTPPTAVPTNLCTRDSALADSILRIKYTTNGGYSGYTPPPGIEVYKAEVEIDTSVSNNYVLDDTYNIKYIAVPTLTTSTWHTYNGTDQSYYVTYGHTSDEVEIEISVPSEYNGLVTYSNNEIRVKKAGKYKVAVNVKKKDGTVNWSSRDNNEKYIEFEIKQSPMDIDLSSGGSNNIEITRGEKATVKVDSMVAVYTGDVLNFDIYATMNGVSSVRRLVYSGLTIDENTNFPLSIDLETAGLSAASYTLELEKVGNGNNNGDYDITIGNAPITLIVNEIGVSSNIRWTFRRDGKDLDSFNQSTSNLTATYGGSIEYNGSAVSISVRAGKLTLDEAYGYKTTQSANNSMPMTNADTYTTSVRLLDENNKAEIYTLTWTIDKAKFDLTNVQWKGNGVLEFNGQLQEMELENLPNKLIATYGGDDNYRDVTTSALHITVDYLDFDDPSDGENYILPDINDPTTYKGNVVWETDWQIIAKKITVQWGKELLTDKNGSPFNIAILRSKTSNSVVVHTYYKSDGNGNKIGGAISESDIVVPESGTEYYICELTLSNSNGYELVGVTTREFAVTNQGTAVKFDPNKQTFAYTGKDVMLRFTNNGNLKSDQYDIKYYDVNDNELTSMPKEVGKYKVRIELKPELSGYFIGGDDEWEIEIVARVITESWNTTSKPPRLNINKTELSMIEYEFADSDGNIISYEQMKSAAGDYKVRAKIKSEYANNCSFTSGSETGWQSFKLEDKDLANMQDPNDPTLYPDDPDMQEPDNNNPSGDVSGDVSTNPEDKGGVDFDKISKILKEWWQVIASGISIVLIIIFTCKGASNLSKAKKAKKATENRYKAYYAAATGLFGWAMNAWTIIASILMGLAVASLVFMILTKVKLNKAQEEMEEARYDYERHKETNRREYDENRRSDELQDLKAILMQMAGNGSYDGMNNANQGMPQSGYMGAQQGIGMDDIRGLISETVTALLPGMQQALPQQASNNDEVVQKLIEQNQELMQKNEKLMQQLIDKPVEKVIEKEVVAANSNDELLRQLLEKSNKNDETISKLMEKIVELSSNQKTESQIVERIVEKPVEKIVEKEVRVEVPVETVVEKVVEKPIVISTEAVGEAEKSKQVKKTPTPKKAPAPRLTLEEAYAKLTKEQKKYFDGLREYAMSKDSKCKEKLSTYFTTIGPSTTNPFIKLTIKKGITVALFKMEDEYLKDIRRNASGDGTKVKVKETEVPIGDKQAYDTAKDMVDLRIDQIDRYNDFLKEQRALRK